jgi:glutathione-regulated potassium-efflux system ancillary protein KefC/glutathione-regulated potassium-efflux system protein KefB
MMSLQEAVIFLAAAVIAVPIFRLLKLSSILGYIAAGLIIGPWGLALIDEVEGILHTSEFGVVLLMFVIGLELQPTRLWILRRTVFGLGTAQVALCTILLGGAAMLWGLPLQSAFVVGFGLSLSSTALVLQILAERGQLKAVHGRKSFGILLFQDIAVLPMLAVLPLISPATADTATNGEPWWIGLAKLIGVVVAVVGGGRLLLRPLLRVVALIRVSEVFTAAALLTVITTALLVNQVGLSMALGAFLAGVILADSEFRHELEADIEPFKGLLLGLFFMAVGMSANLGLLLSQPLMILGTTLGLIGIKLLAVTALGKVRKYPGDSAWRLGFTLAAGGEFAFVLFTLGARENILQQELADLLVLAVTLSMMIAPLLATLYDTTLHKLVTDESKRAFDTIEDGGKPVIIAGFGRFGQIVARVLRARRIPFTALDANQTNVDFVRRYGNKVYYGDASRLDLLRAAGVADAELFVLAIDDVDASLRTAAILRTNFPHLKIFARSRNRQHTFALMELGIQNIVRETLHSSLALSAQLLRALGEPEPQAESIVRKFRRHDEQQLQAQYAVKDDEEKLVAAARESARQLEKLFEADATVSDATVTPERKAV